MKKPSLSLCMIVRNEEANLPLCLKSVQGLVDEMVIVDTGSADATTEIALSFGARVFVHPWENDFSRARNISLDLASGDWILVLDADEVLAVSDHDEVRRLVQGPSTELCSLIQTTYGDESATFGWIPNNQSVPEAAGYPGYIESPLVRLFRRSPLIRFRGIIHEHATHEDPTVPVRATPIRIHHYGKYANPESVRAKDNFYLALSRLKTRENPKDAQAFYELGVQHWALEQRQEARRALLEAERLSPDFLRVQVALASIATVEKDSREAIRRYSRIMELEPANVLPYLYLPTLLADIDQYKLAEEILDAGSACAGHHPTYHINRGVVKQAMGNYRGSISCFREALRLNGQEPLAWINIGISATELGDWEEALGALERALEFPRARDLALKRLAEYHFRRRDFHRSLEVLKKGREEFPGDVEFPYTMAVVLIRKGDRKDAREALAAIHSVRGLESLSIERLRQCHLAVGNQTEAESLRKLLNQTKEGDHHATTT